MGATWWYDNNKSQRIMPSGEFDTRIGYIKYEHTKDTTINNENVHLIKIKDFSYDKTITSSTPIIIKQTNQLVEYKYLGDTQWNFFNILNPTENQTFTGNYFDSGSIQKTFTVSGIGLFTIDGLQIPYYKLNFMLNGFLVRTLQYTNIGSSTNFVPKAIPPTADDFLSEVPFITNLRCFQNGDDLYKFQIGRNVFVNPTKGGNTFIPCDVILYQNITSLQNKDNLENNALPNIVENEILLDNLFNDYNDLVIKIYSLDGRLVADFKLNFNSFTVSNLKNGFYNLIIITKNKIITQKFIKI